MTRNQRPDNVKGVKVTLGLAYDGSIPAIPDDSVGELITGPMGFLRLLETQLGIPSEDVSFTTRLIQYLACLESSNTPERFFHASYAADPFSVARTLLQWRDQWYLAGWDGSFPVEVPARLADMAAVETQAKDQVEPNLGQRIQYALELLHEHIIAIDSITLHDTLADFPPLWRNLIEAIEAPIKEVTPLAPQADEENDLGRLQRRLLSGETRKIELEGDGSVIAIKASSARESAPFIAHITQQWLAEGRDQIALLSEVRGAQLDESLEAAGACRLGFTEYSPWRPIFQVLPLALELLWSPLSARSLLQYLTHPIAPIPRRIREVLVDTVARTPGIGSESWQRTVERCLEAEPEEKRDRYRADITYWLEPDRHDPRAGVAPVVLAQRAQRVADWLMGMREGQDNEALVSLYAVASRQVTDFINAVNRLAEHGFETLNQDNVRRLIEDVRGSGSPLIDREAEVSPGFARLLRADHAGSFNHAVDDTLWWDCQASERVQRWPWSRQERAALADLGVTLQSEDAQLTWLGKAWLRPILAARARLIMVLHADADRHHPVWDQVASAVSNLEMLSLTDTKLADTLQPRFEPLAHRPLPAKHRWWQLPSGTAIPKRRQESYSSLEQFVYSPYQWLLRYPARLRPGALASLSEGNLLKGNLAHRMFEEFFAEHTDIPTIDPAAIAPWVDANSYPLLEREGATLLEQGQQAICERLIVQVKDALESLVAQLQQADVTTVATELHQESHYTGGALTGYIDLLVTRGDGSEAVVDVKWGGLNYRIESLLESQYLQLATYGLFRRQEAGGAVPSLSFFIVESADMLSLNHDFFPGALSLTPRNGEGWGEFWARFEATWRWRREQFDAGLVEVTITNTEPTEASFGPETALPVPEASDTFSDFTALTGWDPGA
jgi:hypothetical protein